MKKKYKIAIEGQNYNIKLEDSLHKCGFFTTRFIEACNPSDAENIVMQMITSELKEIVLNNKSNPPLIHLDEIVEIASFGDNDIPGFGFTWYKEETN